MRDNYLVHRLSTFTVLAILPLAACSGLAGGGPEGPGTSFGTTDGGVFQQGGPPEPGGPFIPIHVRKLSNAEYRASVEDLLGIDPSALVSFAPDVRNSYYTNSMHQRVDETRGDQLQQAADALSAEAVRTRLDALVPCDPSEGGCAAAFVERLASQAFRRPSSEEERAGLLAVFETAAEGGTFADGAQAVIAALLQSASFLYVPALGGGEGVARELTPHEVASALSYFVLGAPPDAALREAADQGRLASGEERTAQFERLLADDPRARRQLRRFLTEWLGVDQLDAAAPVVEGVDYDMLRPLFEQETAAFIDAVLFDGDAALSTLLGANFSVVDGTLASYYGLEASGLGAEFARVSLDGSARRGLLTQGSFLSAHASRDHSSPVKRGVTVLRRLLCLDISFPTGELAQTAMQIPPPDPSATTRERFAVHSTNPSCAACHKQIDPLGFAFEHFDQAGGYRAQENGNPIDASGELTGTDVDGPFVDGASLIARLSDSDQVRRCFARNVFRFGSSLSSSDGERAFMELWEALPAGEQDDVLAILRAYVGSDMFIQRSVP